MAGILKIRNPDTGGFVEIPAIQGVQGPQGPKGDQPPLSTSAPLALGVASSGSSTIASREDHVHPMPSAADIGAASAEEVSQLKDDIRVNLLRPTLQTITLNGVTCTNNGDGTYTLNGTASNLTYFKLRNMEVKKGTYKFVGMNLVNRGYLVASDGIFAENTITNIDTPLTAEFMICCFNGSIFNNDVVKPMFTTDLEATYDDFVPYDDSLVKGRDVIDKSSIGDAWTSGKTYAVGDYCISGNRLYKCKTAHTAGSSFNADYWDAVNVAEEIKSIDYKSYFSEAVTGITILDDTRMIKSGNMIYGTLHFKTTEEISNGTDIINIPAADAPYYCFTIIDFSSKIKPYTDGILSTYFSLLKYYGVSNLPPSTYCASIQYLNR